MRNAGLVVAALPLAACGNAAPTAQNTPDPTPVALSSPSPLQSPTSSPAHLASPSPAHHVSPSPVTPAPTPPKPVSMTCSSQVPSGASLALVTLRGSTDIVVRDLTDISHPVSRCAFKTCIQNCVSFGPRSIRFIDSTHVSYL